MNRQEFKELCQSKIVLLDGATGTNLQKAGMPVGVCPEQWILEHPQVIQKLQREFLAAGTDILYAPTFSANRIKLEEYGLGDRLVQMNTELVRLSKEAVREFEDSIGYSKLSLQETVSGAEKKTISDGEKTKKRHFIAGDLTMTGQLVYPVGTMQFEDLVEIYKEQAQALVTAGVDLFVVETMMSLQECRAAVLAVKETCSLPVMVTLTFAADQKTMYGTTPEAAVVVLQALGADAIGVNCSSGPETMTEIISRMAAVAEVPIIAKPNAGMPKLVEEKTIYEMSPCEFAAAMEKLVEAGASIVGGCCGSEPAHIQAVHQMIQNQIPPEMKEKKAFLSTEYNVSEIALEGPTRIIGERINPTGKKMLQAELREGKLDLVLRFAKEQEEAGAYVLDVNAGMSGISEKERMLEIVYALMQESSLPLSIDSSHVDVIEAVLRIYPGRALVNSISCEKEKMEQLLPIVKKYGAMFILLPLSERGLPKDLEEKKQLIHTVMEAADKAGFRKKDIVVDGLVNTIGAGKQAAKETLAAIRYCREELGVATSIGLSNISFGLPARSFVNSSFLIMAIEAGLTMAIANPCQKTTMDYLLAADLLLGKEGADLAFIEAAPQMEVAKEKEKGVQKTAERKEQQKESGSSKEVSDRSKENRTAGHSALFEAVLKGKRNEIENLTNIALADCAYGETPELRADKILKEELIPAINRVGELFEQQRYFLPQLIASAETMERSVKQLEPLLLTGEEKKQGKVVIATVQGDIHDIGKNLVALMLKNYGFEVLDLGKDVASEHIVETAMKEQADLIALSALMTTTMTRMKEVVALKKERDCMAKVMIGGAVTTEEYAKEIGADGYSKDAQDAVKVARKLLGKK